MRAASPRVSLEAACRKAPGSRAPGTTSTTCVAVDHLGDPARMRVGAPLIVCWQHQVASGQKRGPMQEPTRSVIAVLLVLLLASVVAACDSDESANTTVVSGTVVTVLEDHAAAELHTMNSVEEASAAAQANEIDIACGTFFPALGQSEAGDPSACMVSDRGVVAVIAFGSVADLSYVVSGPAIGGEVGVPVTATEVYGVEATPGRISLTVMYGNTVIGTLTFGA